MDTEKTLTIEYASVEELVPYVNNARIHGEDQVAQIAASIKEFGFNVPIVTDGDNGILAGHGRLLAARKLGLDKVPVIRAAHLTKAQRKAFILADNKIGDNSSFDYDILRLEFEALGELGVDLDIAGFSQFEVEAINTESAADLLDNGIRPDADQDGSFESDDGEERVHQVFMVFGTKSVQLTDAELELLYARYDAHVEEHGTEFGFVTALLSDLDE